ncbi:Wzz/FepE/Etk N-terminal domain-containing protein [Thauera sp.]|uniref:Wzz/FepE/Etk N-terminal domain-containing protein n=1 Tax=Thauera sp. TaxID=1905334 RepID=UPI0039E359C0
MQNSQPTPQPQVDEEISLYELWQILAKRKALILACLLVCLAAGAAYAFLKPPVYEASVKLRIGQVRGSGGLHENIVLENAEELSSRILAQYGEDIADGIKRNRPFITGARAEKGVTTTIQLTAEGDAPQDAAHLLEEVTDTVIKAHSVMYEANIKPIAERLKNLDEQRRALQQQYSDITALVDQLKARDSVQASLVMIERGPITAALDQQGAERLSLSAQMLPPQTRPTELLSPITAPAKPSQPKKALTIVASTIFGIIAALILAILMEFVAKPKARSAP